MTFSPRTTREVRRLALDVVLLDGEQDAAPSLADMARRAKALLDGPLREKRIGIPKAKAPGRTKEERQEEEDARERAAKDGAFSRSEDPPGKPRCEVWLLHGRCMNSGTDADHVIGGIRKRDMERLGAEGFQIMCRTHHDLKTTNTPSRGEWLRQAEEHAIRTGAKGLMPHIHAARARYAAKHGEPVRIAVRGGTL